MVDARKLHGLSIDRAECYGKPHINAFYTGNGLRAYKRDDVALCPLCGRPATNTHHQPDRFFFRFMLKDGGYIALRPALMAVCGSGTTGCHGDIEAFRTNVRWRWDSDEYESAWWDGTMLSSGLGAHDERLYHYGCWVFENDGKEIEYRGGFDG